MPHDSLLEPQQLGTDSLNEKQPFISADEALAQDVSTTLANEDDTATAGTLSSKLIETINSKYEESNRHRESDEQRWLQAYQNYRGYYAKNIKFRETEKSRVFVKVTKTKVLAAYGQLIDVLFGANKFPLSIKPTKVPEGAVTLAHFKVDGAPDAETGTIPENAIASPETPAPIDPYAKNNLGFEGDGRDIQEEIRTGTVGASIGLDLDIPEEDKEKIVEGHGAEGEAQFKPAQEAAMRMEKLIHDQIDESKGERELSSAIFEAALLGTGIVKGPFTTDKILHRWTYDPDTKQRTYTPETVKVPRMSFVSVFDAFPDPNGTTIENCEWFIERHKMSRSQIRALKVRPYFRKDMLNKVLKTPPNYVNEDFENDLIAENNQIHPTQDRYEVLEYWGMLDRDDLMSEYLKTDGFLEEDLLDEVQVNVWICAGMVLRIILNPFSPKKLPYHAFDYERNPYSFFGVGVAENMSDSQLIMNGHMRMAIDNLALAGNLVFDVDENSLSAGQNMEIFPGKIFKRASGQPGQSIFGIKFPNTAPENMQIFDKFRQIADESTGIPSYAHGQTGVMSTTRTAAGMSMLMGAATMSVKTVVKNIDDYLLRPLGESYFQWNMAFYEGELNIVGDLEVSAGGAASLMQGEVKSQRLTAFGQLLANPAIAPYVKIPAYIREFTQSLELDPDEMLNNEDEAKVQAAIMGAAGGLPQQGTPQGGGGLGQVGGVPAPALPGDTQFAGNEGTPPTPEGGI